MPLPDLVTAPCVTFTVSALHPPWPLQSSFEYALWLSPSWLLQENTRDWVANKQHNSFFTVWSLEAQSQSANRFSVWRGSATWFIVVHFLEFWMCPHMVGGARELSGVPFVRDVISFMRSLLLWPHHLQKVPPLNTISLGVRVQHINGGVSHSVYNTVLSDTRDWVTEWLNDHSTFTIMLDRIANEHWASIGLILMTWNCVLQTLMSISH